MTNQQTSSACESEQLWLAYSRIATPHLAVTGDTVELNYTRVFVDLLLHILVPYPHLESQSGRFVVGELITCNVFLPLVSKLSNPDWLNILLVEIFRQSSKPRESVAAEPVTTVPQLSPPSVDGSDLAPVVETSQRKTEAPLGRTETETVTETQMPQSAASDTVDNGEVVFPQTSAEEEERSFLEGNMGGRKSNPFYQENDSDLDSPLVDYKQSSTGFLLMIGQEELVYDKRKECTTSVDNNISVDSVDVSPCPVNGSCPNILVNSEHPNGFSPSLVKGGDVSPNVSGLQDVEREARSPSVNPTSEHLLSVEQSGLVSSTELTAGSPQQVNASMPSFSFEPLSSPDGPVIIQNLRITGTITAKEHRGTGSHPYTLYTIKVSAGHGHSLHSQHFNVN